MNTLLISSCACGSEFPSGTCCQLFITGDAVPETPLQLMRSRYTAYSHANIGYILATMRGIAAKNFNEREAEQWAACVHWEKLEIIHAPPTQGNTGFVEFKAYYTHAHQLQVIHETSKFKRLAGRWYYISGHTHQP